MPWSELFAAALYDLPLLQHLTIYHTTDQHRPIKAPDWFSSTRILFNLTSFAYVPTDAFMSNGLFEALTKSSQGSLQRLQLMSSDFLEAASVLPFFTTLHHLSLDICGTWPHKIDKFKHLLSGAIGFCVDLKTLTLTDSSRGALDSAFFDSVPHTLESIALRGDNVALVKLQDLLSSTKRPALRRIDYEGKCSAEKVAELATKGWEVDHQETVLSFYRK